MKSFLLIIIGVALVIFVSVPGIKNQYKNEASHGLF